MISPLDLWAIGCILYELLTLEPLFHCKQDDIKASSPFNRDALEKIFQILGYPSGTSVRTGTIFAIEPFACR